MHDDTSCPNQPWFGANDRYHLCRPLRAGQFGEVWDAWDNHEAIRVALKLIRDPGHGATFEEAQRLVEMTGDRVVKVFNADIHNDVPYIAMEFAPYGDLESRIPVTGVSTSTAVRWLQSILSGVEACHRRRLIHRDIKPSNVLVFDRFDDIRLGDFGVAALSDPHGLVTVHGDRLIVAPEGLSTGTLTILSDVYSAALTGYILLTGAPPNRPHDTLRLIDDIADRCPHLPARVVSALRRGWAHDPADRYGSATAFREALANVTLPAYDWALEAADEDEKTWYGTHASRESVRVMSHRRNPATIEISAIHVDSGRTIRRLSKTSAPERAATDLRKLFRDLDGGRKLVSA